MMRYACVTAMTAVLFSAPAFAQQPVAPANPPTGRQQLGAQQQPLAQQQPSARVARQTPQARQSQSVQSQDRDNPNAGNRQPIPPLNAADQQQLDQFLAAWERQSKGTKTLDLKFKRWHYDNKAAAAGIHSTKAEGVIRYANPDKGLFRVDSLLFFNGMQNGEPKFKEIPGRFGEHWICNGKQLIEMDRSKETCEIQDLPPEMQGTQIFNSPLPFVFNLDARQIKQRYWIRLREVPETSLVMVEAWPKRQEDRAQYKLVQIGLDPKTFIPQALVLYAPNFDLKTAPNRDQYEFSKVKRNAIGAGLQQFVKNFIPEKPPKNWKIVRNTFNPIAPPPENSGQPASRAPTAQGAPDAQNARGPATPGQPQAQ